MKNFNLIIIGSLISIIFWFLESFIHLSLDIVDKIEILPEDINELWMRSLIVFLIIAMSIYAQVSQNKLRKIERDKSLLQEQLLEEQYSNMEVILDNRKQTQVALHNFNSSVMTIRVKIEEGEMISAKDVSLLSSATTAVQNKINRLWG